MNFITTILNRTAHGIRLYMGALLSSPPKPSNISYLWNLACTLGVVVFKCIVGPLILELGYFWYTGNSFFVGTAYAETPFTSRDVVNTFFFL